MICTGMGRPGQARGSFGQGRFRVLQERWRSKRLALALRTQAHRFNPKSPGGARRDRTDDLMLAKHALSQLSYGPAGDGFSGRKRFTADKRITAHRRFRSPRRNLSGGPGRTRTSDLTLIKRAL